MASEFRAGRIVCLTSMASHKTLRSVDHKGTVEGLGAHGDLAQWLIHSVRGGSPAEPHIKLQSIKHSNLWLRIDEHGHTNAAGSGGEWCDFALVCHPDGTVSLRSVPNWYKHKHAWYVGVQENGAIRSAKDTGTGHHGRFKPVFIK